MRAPRQGMSAARWSTGIAIVLLLLAPALAACGKAGPPTPPPGAPDTYPRPYPRE